ncbi:hypothetical protein B0O99DRAFT_591223 [Bisporella sp. PMI_857]|nr:hypothetical protein B0O99DRAFT_591223 [Bisporella sp. PMI_857]
MAQCSHLAVLPHPINSNTLGTHVCCLFFTNISAQRFPSATPASQAQTVDLAKKQTMAGSHERVMFGVGVGVGVDSALLSLRVHLRFEALVPVQSRQIMRLPSSLCHLVREGLLTGYREYSKVYGDGVGWRVASRYYSTTEAAHITVHKRGYVSYSNILIRNNTGYNTDYLQC